MSGAEVAQIITSLATLVAAIGALMISWRNAAKIEAVHIATNSLTDRLVNTTRTEAHAAGVKEQKDREGT